MRCPSDLISVTEESLRLYLEDPKLCHALDYGRKQFENYSTCEKVTKRTREDQKHFLTFGLVYRVQYPWMTDTLTKAPITAIQAANDEFHHLSDCLELRPVTPRTNLVGESRYGVFATRNIKKDEVVLRATTPFDVYFD